VIVWKRKEHYQNTILLMLIDIFVTSYITSKYLL